MLCPTCHTLVDTTPADHPISLLKKWKQEWESTIQARLNRIMSATPGDLLSLEMRLWTYFNFDLILRLMSLIAPTATLCPHNLRQLGMLDAYGFPLASKDSRNARTIFSTWGADDRHIQRHFSDLVEQILRGAAPIDLDDIWGVRKLTGLLYPSAIAFTNRRFFFKPIEPSEPHQRRQVHCTAKGIRLEYQIDTWQVFSESSLDLHFRGSSKIASLLYIRSVEKEFVNGKSMLIIKATPVAIGTGFWSDHDRTPSVAYQIEEDEDEWEDWVSGGIDIN